MLVADTEKEEETKRQLKNCSKFFAIIPKLQLFLGLIDLRNALFLFVDNKHLHGFLGEICLPARLQPKVSSPTQSHPCRPHPKVTNEIKNKNQCK